MSAAVNEWFDEPTAVIPREEVEQVRYYIGSEEVCRATWETLAINAQWLRDEGIQIEVER